MDDPAAAPPVPVPEPDDAKFSDDPLEHSSISACLVALIIIAWLIFGHKIQGLFRWTRCISEGSMACILGLLSGLALLAWHAIQKNDVTSYLSFHSATFFTYMLPPIIFYGGLSIERELFVSNVFSILSFGVVGTFVSFLLLGTILKGLSMIPNVLSFSDSLALAAIFAATDSVAVLQVLRPEQQPALYSIVLGEGVMNDATSVALLKVVGKLGDEGSVLLLGAKIGAFFGYVFLASCALGLLSGLAITLVMKHLQPFSQPQEISLVGALAFLTYLMAELVGLSGILALFFCGMVVSHYTLQHVSPTSRTSLRSAFQTLSYLSEGAIFLYVGRDALDPAKWAHADFFETLYIVAAILVIIALSRACFVFPLAWLHNRWSTTQLSVNESIVIWWAGMMRGAVSIAMVYYQVDPNNNRTDRHAATLVVATLQIVLFSTIGMGGVTGPLLQILMPNKVASGSTLHVAGGRGRGGGGGGSCSARLLDGRLWQANPEYRAAPASQASSAEWDTADDGSRIELAGVRGRGALTRRASSSGYGGELPEYGESSQLLPAGARPSHSAGARPAHTHTAATISPDARATHGASSPTNAGGQEASLIDASPGGDAAAAAMEAGQSASGEGGAVAVMGERMLRAAQSWADFTLFDTGGITRGSGSPGDGAVGSAVYETFKRFDDKYMQPLFGADSPDGRPPDSGRG